MPSAKPKAEPVSIDIAAFTIFLCIFYSMVVLESNIVAFYLVLHRYDFLADIPITDIDIISKADNYNRSDIS